MNRLYIIVIAIAGALVASAQNTFDAIVGQIIENNPELQSLKRQAYAAALDNADANALADPEVEFARVWGRNQIGNKLQLDISQQFEWPGVYSARSRAAKMEMQVADAEYQAARFKLEADIRALLVELVYVRAQLAVISDLKTNCQNLSDAIDKGVRGGELTVLDQRKMQIEAFEIDNQMTSIMSREVAIIGELEALTSASLDLTDVTAYPVLPILDVEQYVEAAASSPEVVAQRLMVDAEALNATVAARRRMPGFSVGYQHQAEMGDRFNGFTVGMNLPVFSSRHARRAALERKEAAELAETTAMTRITADIRGTYADMLIQRERITAYRSAFGDNKYLSLLLKAYEGGEISVIDYLSEIHYFHQTMLTFLESEYNYNLALSKLNSFRL